jgi:hypothetical protein
MSDQRTGVGVPAQMEGWRHILGKLIKQKLYKIIAYYRLFKGITFVLG